MAVFSKEIPDELQGRIEAAFSAEFGYQETDPPDPAAKTAFTYARVMLYIMDITTSYESRVAGEAAAATAREQARTDFAVLLEPV